MSFGIDSALKVRSSWTCGKNEFVNALHVNTYNDYILSEDASGEAFVDVNDMAPVLHVKRNPWKAVMTLGWRF